MKILLSVILLLTTNIYSQSPIDLAENTFKLGATGEEFFYYGFAEGDQLVFNFEELKGKQLKEIEISGLESTSLFMDYESTSIKDRTIKIPKTGIYKIRFHNSTLVGRICKFKVQRIPVAGKEQFNSTVMWKTLYDTTYYTVQEDYLISKDTAIVNVINQIAKVHSYTNANGCKTYFNFNLPIHTVSWSYYIGVDQAGQKAYEDATIRLAKLSNPVSKIPGFGPLAALAFGIAPMISVLQSGEDVQYYIVPGDENARLFMAGQAFLYLKKGLVINDFAQMNPASGNLFVCLYNDNAVYSITPTIKVTAVTVKENWGKRNVQKMTVTSRKEAYLEG